MAEVEGWAQEFSQVEALLGPRFGRREPRARAVGYVRSLMAPLERKNGWTISEATGARSPDSVQWLLTGADWDPDLLRDDLRSWVAEELGDPDGVLVVDDTGFLKKGIKSAGVQRQYSGTAGRIENCQIGVFLAYAAPAGRTLLDRELYLPKSWTEDRDRCTEAGVSAAVGFATKPELAETMLHRALNAGVPAAWVTGDEAYGQVSALRRSLVERGMSYVLAVPANQRVHPADSGSGPREGRIDDAVAALDARCWTTITVGAGAKGPRTYQWARARVRPLPAERGEPEHWLLARRSLTDPTDLAYYLAAAPAKTPLRELARIAGVRWAIEETFQTAKNEVGLDHYQVRRYGGWYRHITLAMLAHAFLTITRAGTRSREKGGPGPSQPRSAS
ncbi:MAG: Transposase [uncultured Friedmanniella sp.]|uniref:Transposase n=1 Tax=uncultured Friedmanniella sp. TaxID=335381 RepID=A0A6J4LGA7_9ACTN|nr:MAG: Transposase [uncultured Friedmanniella sp.]